MLSEEVPNTKIGGGYLVVVYKWGGGKLYNKPNTLFASLRIKKKKKTRAHNRKNDCNGFLRACKLKPTTTGKDFRDGLLGLDALEETDKIVRYF